LAITVRPERAADYPAIADTHIRAFRNRSGESLLVAVHRLRPEFDPELSLVAEVDGRIAGHALFSPRRLSILGEAVSAVNVAPVGVRPEFQRSGVGGALMRRGMEVATAKGYQLAFLLGHREYYPRFGFVTNAYGHSHLLMRPADLPAVPATEYEERGVWPEDLNGLEELRVYCERGVSFTVLPALSLADWISTHPAVRSTVFRRNGETVGYARYEAGNADRVSCFLARDREAAAVVLRTIARTGGIRGDVQIKIPLHPDSPATAELFADISVAAVPHSPAAAMAAALRPGIFDLYLTRLQAGKIPPGRITWPVEFELLD